MAMATTCLTRFSSNVTLCLRFAFSVLIAIRSSFEVNTTAGDASVRGEGSITGLTSTSTLDGGGATFDKLTPLLTISDGIPRSLAKDNTSCSVEASRAGGCAVGSGVAAVGTGSVDVGGSPFRERFSASNSTTRFSSHATWALRALRDL